MIYTIDNHLNLKGHRKDNLVWESSLVIALRDARKSSGRNEETGIVETNQTCGYSGCWLGAIGYLTVLDLIGKTYKPKESLPLTKTNSHIDSALQYFGNVTYENACAIYALRCSLMHDYNLINLGKSKPELNHVFTVDVAGPLVSLRTCNAPAIFELPISINSITTINLRALGDKVEEIYKELIYLNSVQKLGFVQSSEMLKKYFWSHP